jgi:hypothetical protein
MRLLRFSRILFFALTAVLGMTIEAREDFITGELAGTAVDGGILNPGAAVMINHGNGPRPSIEYYPGEVDWTVTTPPHGKPNASWVPAVGSSFQSFSIELTQDIRPGKSYTYSLENLADDPKPGSKQTGGSGGMGEAKANAIAALWAEDYRSIANPTGASNADINAAAFQLAIWKIEYDWDNSKFTLTGNAATDFSSGNFRASAIAGNADSAAAIAQADSWLYSLGWDSTSFTNEASLVALRSPHAQDQVMALPTPDPDPPTSVPAPPTLHLAGLAAVALSVYGGCRRRLARGVALS